MIADRTKDVLRHAKMLTLNNGVRSIKGKIGGDDLSDSYRVKVAHGIHFAASLRTSRADAAIALLNSKGVVLSKSARNGKTGGTINLNLKAGTYTVWVRPRHQQETHYRLNLALFESASQSAPTPNVPRSNRFDIQFDYRFDTNGWFTPERRAALEAAAGIWERVIASEFPTTPVGTRVGTFENPQTGQLISQFKVDTPIDDVRIFVGARELDSFSPATLAVSGPSVDTTSTRYTGANFEPSVGTIAFDSSPTTNWFFDPTPDTATDIPIDRYDFISTAAHEIAHVLGFGLSSAFLSHVETTAANQRQFVGHHAEVINGGNPMPLSNDAGHIRQGYQFGGSGEPLMSPTADVGQRKLPTVLDLAVLNDLGYSVDYRVAAQNSLGLLSSSIAQTAAINIAQQRSRQRRPARPYGACGCASCLAHSYSARL
jgi:hypothetical protein